MVLGDCEQDVLLQWEEASEAMVRLHLASLGISIMQLTAKVAQHSLQKNVLVSAEDRTTTQVPLAKSSRHQHCLGESLCQGGTPVTRVVLEDFHS